MSRYTRPNHSLAANPAELPIVRRASSWTHGFARNELVNCVWLEPKLECEVQFTEWTDEHYRSEEHTSELQSLRHLVCRLLLEKKKKHNHKSYLIHNT